MENLQAALRADVSADGTGERSGGETDLQFSELLEAMRALARDVRMTRRYRSPATIDEKPGRVRPVLPSEV